jgi:hypothetical protein
MSLDVSRQIQRQSSLRRSAMAARRKTQPVRQAVYGGGRRAAETPDVHFRVVDEWTYDDTLVCAPLEHSELFDIETIRHEEPDHGPGGSIFAPIHTFVVESYITAARVVNQETAATGFGPGATCTITLKLPGENGGTQLTVASVVFRQDNPFPAPNASKPLAPILETVATAKATLQLTLVTVGEVDYIQLGIHLAKPPTLRVSDAAFAALKRLTPSLNYEADQLAVPKEQSQSRLVTIVNNPSVRERQIVVPRYRKGSVLRGRPFDAVLLESTGAFQVKWEDVNNDGRQFAKRFFS